MFYRGLFSKRLKGSPKSVLYAESLQNYIELIEHSLSESCHLSGSTEHLANLSLYHGLRYIDCIKDLCLPAMGKPIFRFHILDSAGISLEMKHLCRDIEQYKEIIHDTYAIWKDDMNGEFRIKCEYIPISSRFSFLRELIARYDNTK